MQIEAHAAGTPVVSTDLPTGVPYANLDGVTGLIVPPGDAPRLRAALRRLLGDDELRARLGRPGPARAPARVHGPAHGRAARWTCTPRPSTSRRAARRRRRACGARREALSVAQPLHRALHRRRRRAGQRRLRPGLPPALRGPLPAFNFEAYLLLAPLLTLLLRRRRLDLRSLRPRARRHRLGGRPRRRRGGDRRHAADRRRSPSSAAPARPRSRARRSCSPGPSTSCCSPAGAWPSCASAACSWPEQRVLIVGTDAASVELAEEVVAARPLGLDGRSA